MTEEYGGASQGHSHISHFMLQDHRMLTFNLTHPRWELSYEPEGLSQSSTKPTSPQWDSPCLGQEVKR